MKNVGELSDAELLARLTNSIGEERRWTARVVAYLAEIERRRLHLEAACSSLFDFCRRRLKMSDGEAFRRKTAAQLVQQFPSILDWLDRGDVHLSALVLLRDHLTQDNHEELLREAAGKSKLEIQELIAARFPRPDVPPRISCLEPQVPLTTPSSSASTEAVSTQQPEPRPRVEPLSPARYRIEVTVSHEIKAKLDRITDLMRHRNPSGDLEIIVDRALDLLLAKLEKERLGKATRPRAKKLTPGEPNTEPTASTTRYVAADVRRAVIARDGGQCAFVDKEGRRCEGRGFLELDHRQSKALGGVESRANLRVFCRAHNRLHAERTFGREFVEAKIRLRQRKCGRAATATAPLSDSPAYDAAARGLTNMGFREPDVRRTLAQVKNKLGSSGVSVETVVREALAALT